MANGHDSPNPNATAHSGGHTATNGDPDAVAHCYPVTYADAYPQADTNTHRYAQPPTPTPFPYQTQNIRWIRQNRPGLYATILRLPWIDDGLNATDKAAIDQILYIAVKDTSVA